MGCWGITALESDAGLDAVGFIRDMLPEGGGIRLEQMIAALKKITGTRRPIRCWGIPIPARWHWRRSC